MPKRNDLEKWNDAMYLTHPTPYFNKLAGIIERKRVEKIVELANVKATDRLLEIGCEQGVLLDAFPECKKTGLDISAVALKDARRRADQSVKLYKADAEAKIDLFHKPFDIIVCSQVLEHVHNPRKVLANIKNLAKEDSRILISVPNEIFLLKTKKLLKKIGILQLLFPGIEPGISEWHLQTFTHSKFKKMVEDNFHIVKHVRAYNIYLIYLLKLK